MFTIVVLHSRRRASSSASPSSSLSYSTRLVVIVHCPLFLPHLHNLTHHRTSVFFIFPCINIRYPASHCESITSSYRNTITAPFFHPPFFLHRTTYVVISHPVICTISCTVFIAPCHCHHTIPMIHRSPWKKRGAFHHHHHHHQTSSSCSLISLSFRPIYYICTLRCMYTPFILLFPPLHHHHCLFFYLSWRCHICVSTHLLFIYLPITTAWRREREPSVPDRVCQKRAVIYRISFHMSYNNILPLFPQKKKKQKT